MKDWLKNLGSTFFSSYFLDQVRPSDKDIPGTDSSGHWQNCLSQLYHWTRLRGIIRSKSIKIFCYVGKFMRRQSLTVYGGLCVKVQGRDQSANYSQRAKSSPWLVSVNEILWHSQYPFIYILSKLFSCYSGRAE